MKIKTYKGYNDTMGVEVQGKLTLEDFIIEETAPTFTYFDAMVRTKLTLTLKEDLVKELMPILTKTKGWDHESKKEVITPTTSFTKSFSKAVAFNGCRTQEAKDRKIKKIQGELALSMAEKKETRIEKILEEVNNELIANAEDMNKYYETGIMEVMTGKNMSKKFIQENLDSPNIREEIDSIDKEIEALREKQAELREVNRVSCNKHMLKYLEENGWNDDEEKVVIAPHLRKKLTSMYENGEAFATKGKKPFLFEVEL